MEHSRLSFRSKLLLALLLLVAGVTGTTLLVTQQQVGAAYDWLFQERLIQQLTYLPKQQEARLDLLLRQSRTFAESVEVQNGFHERNATALYNLARDQMLRLVTSEFDQFAKELNAGQAPTPAPVPAPPPPKASPRVEEQRKEKTDLLPSSKPKPAPKGRPAVEPPAAATFIGFMDAAGSVLQPADGLPAIYQNAARKRFREQLEALAGPLRTLEAQQVAYMDLAMEPGTPGRLLELICLPVLDNQTRQRLGTFVLSFPHFDGGEQAISEVGDIESGVWFQGQLYTRTIPEAVRAELSRQLAPLLEGECSRCTNACSRWWASLIASSTLC